MLKTINSSYIKSYLLASFMLRLALIAYGVYHDAYSSVSYTDVDYKVFTDAARHVIRGKSPYDRYTYRYSPLLAIMLIPNVLIHYIFGKVLFSIIDIGVGLLLRVIVMNGLKELKSNVDKIPSKLNPLKVLHMNDETFCEGKNNGNHVRQRRKSKHQLIKKPKIRDASNKNDITCSMADKSMLIWIFNPFAMVISTRGNCDCIAVFFVLYTLYCLQIKKNNFLAGLMFGLSIHFRLYPIIYCLTLFMYLSKYSYYKFKPDVEPKADKPDHLSSKQGVNTNSFLQLKTKQVLNANSVVQGNSFIIPANGNERKTIFKMKYLLYLIPNKNQLKLISGTVISLCSLTYIFYYIYGYRFIYETYVYHFLRTDFRHNFSLYFYLQYLTAWIKNIGLWQKALMVIPQMVLLLVFSVRYGLDRFSLNFAILLQTIVFVIYNRVLTSQYFVWIMALLPLCIWQIKISQRKALFILSIWLIAQAAWLLPAYLLEFQGENTFMFIWIQSVSFFCANIAILGRLIIHFMSEEK